MNENKKDSVLILRIPHILKERIIATSKKDGVSMSQVIRSFIEKFYGK
jgi:antitoxin component of RelBE/YafQ-DinJ toxin-antitoxin module